MDNQTAVSLKITNSITGEAKLERYAEKLKIIKSALSGLDTSIIKDIESGAGSTSQISDDVKNISKKTNLAFNYSVVTRFSTAIKGLVRTISHLSAQSSAFLEDFNLFQVAFDGNYESSLKFVNTLSEMYGLDEGWLMRTTGIFKQLANAMDLSVETGEKLSELLTRMSIDISSLYNVDVEKASQVLQSAMAGQTKPVRGTTGGDITQATLQTTLDKLGINEYIGNLSFAEKRLVIIISLTQQLSKATGDWGRTLESPANQLRILDEQWTRLSRAVGNLFINTLGKVLPYLNAILMVLTEIISVIATLFGYNLKDYDYFGNTVGNAWDLDNALTSAGSSAKKLKQGLRGFDKLNVITTPSSGGGGAGAGGSGIDPKIMEAFNKAYDEYLSKIENVEMKATKIRDKIMEILGFTKEIDPITGDIVWKYNGWEATIKGLWGWFKELNFQSKLLVGLGIGVTITNIVRALKAISKLTGVTAFFKGINKYLGKQGLYGWILNIKKTGGIAGLFATGSSKLTTFATSLGLSVNALGGIAVAITAVAGAFIYAYNTSDEFKNKIDTMVSSVKKMLGELYDAFSKVFKTIYKAVEPVINGIGNLLKILTGVIYETIILAFKNFADVVKGVCDTITKLVNGDFKGAFDSLTNMVINLHNNYKDFMSKLAKLFVEVLGKIVVYVIEFVPKLISEMAKILTWLANLPSEFIKWIKESFKQLLESARNIKWSDIGKEIKDNIKEKLSFDSDDVTKWAKNLYNAIKKAIQDVDWGKLGKDIMKSIVDGMKIKTNISFSPSSIGKKVGNYFKDIFKDGLPLNITGLYGAFANGGLPPVGQLFVANEKGPELVGQIGGQSFVANQNQMMNLLDKKIGNASGGINDATFVIQVGDKEIARTVLSDLQSMAKSNGKTITIG